MVLHHVKNVLREVKGRTETHGYQSGWICGRTHAVNFIYGGLNRSGAFRNVECPCCGWTGYRFRTLDCGRFSVPQVECPNCKAHERHRMMHLFLTRRPPEFMKRSGIVLHFAAEQQVRDFILAVPGLVPLTTDYDFKQAKKWGAPGFTSDIHKLVLANNSVDGIFCLHVLEHVADDRCAVQELYRVLKPGGLAVIMVPFMMGQTETIEYGAPDPEIFDHVRGYSPLDFKSRLAPFHYEEITPDSLMTPDEIQRYKVPDSQGIYLCTK